MYLSFSTSVVAHVARKLQTMKLVLKATVAFSILLGSIWSTTFPVFAANLDLSAYKGKVVLLDFWASWCNPCRQSFPWMNAMAETMGPKGLVVIAVNVDHDRELADEFLRANDARFTIVYDPNGAIASKYQFRDMPTSFLIGRDGKVHYVHNGFFPDRESEYFSDISRLLNQTVQ